MAAAPHSRGPFGTRVSFPGAGSGALSAEGRGADARCGPWSGSFWSRGSYSEAGPGASLGMGVRRGAGRSAVPSRPHLATANSSLRALSTRGQALCRRCTGQSLPRSPRLPRWAAHVAAGALRPERVRKPPGGSFTSRGSRTVLRGVGPAPGSRPAEEGLPHLPALLRTPWSRRAAPAGPTKPDSGPSQGQEASSAGFTGRQRSSDLA